MTDSAAVTAFQRAGQGHVFAFFDRLDAEGRRRLLRQAAEVDLDEIGRLARSLEGRPGAGGGDHGDLLPAPYVPLPWRGGDAAAWGRAEAAGIEALRQGKVAACTVAGGQGTRLGYDGPKGTFPVTPVRAKSLFQVLAEKIRAAGVRHGRPLHWFIMTSHQNHEATEAYFAERRHFGLDPARVHFFRQGRLPAVDFSGRIMLEAPDAIALSPDGHGGSLRALERSGALDLMASEGVTTLSYFQVDNPLTRCVDPAFLGWHLTSRSEMSSKMVPKAYPEEKVGHFCLRGGGLTVIEYSDLPMERQREKDAEGRLRFVAGNIAVHVLDREFVRRQAAAGGMPFHRAEKKIPTVDAGGNPVKPDRPNGVKFELFIFDAIPFARNPLVVETSREDDFAPVKNAEGVDSPKTCAEAQQRQFARWLRAAGAAVPEGPIEISPLFGADEKSFLENWKKLSPKPAIADGFYLE
jgi:UDP-N-acetylglucosamine/UDP-N-acetylgalactosamine diphosphorylase